MSEAQLSADALGRRGSIPLAVLGMGVAAGVEHGA
jgi:hypothetical protein